MRNSKLLILNKSREEAQAFGEAADDVPRNKLFKRTLFRGLYTDNISEGHVISPHTVNGLSLLVVHRKVGGPASAGSTSQSAMSPHKIRTSNKDLENGEFRKFHLRMSSSKWSDYFQRVDLYMSSYKWRDNYFQRVDRPLLPIRRSSLTHTDHEKISMHSGPGGNRPASNAIYGPADVAEVEEFIDTLKPQNVLQSIDSETRNSFYTSIFNNHVVPTEYDENDLLYRAAQFAATCVFHKRYSSAILGEDDRACVVDVIYDMIELTNYISKLKRRVSPGNSKVNVDNSPGDSKVAISPGDSKASIFLGDSEVRLLGKCLSEFIKSHGTKSPEDSKVEFSLSSPSSSNHMELR